MGGDLNQTIPTVSFRDEDFKDSHDHQLDTAIGDTEIGDVSTEAESHVALMGIVQLIAGSQPGGVDDDSSDDDDWDVDEKLFSFASAKALRGEACGLFGTRNRIRLLATDIVHHRGFEWFLSCVITLLLVTLILDSPGNRLDEETKSIFAKIDVLVAVIFTVEAALRIISAGFVVGEHTYLRSGWNQLDFLIVCGTWFSLAYGKTEHFLPQQVARLQNATSVDFTSEDGVAMATLRVLRLLRPLHSLRFFGGLKMILHSLKHAIPNVKTVMLLLSIFIVVASSFGLNLFGGALSHQCTSGSSEVLPTECPAVLDCAQNECSKIPNNFDHEQAERKDAVGFFGFDNLVQALGTIMISAPQLAWHSQCTDSGVNMVYQPFLTMLPAAHRLTPQRPHWTNGRSSRMLSTLAISRPAPSEWFTQS